MSLLDLDRTMIDVRLSPEGRLSRRSLLQCACAGGLAAIGLAPEQRLLLFGTDSLDYVTTWLGSVYLGAIPVVLLTAKADQESRNLAFEEGAVAYLGKPFDERELLSIVRNLLKITSQERRIAELRARIAA